MSENFESVEYRQQSSAMHDSPSAGSLFGEYLAMFLVLHSIGLTVIAATTIQETPAVAVFLLIVAAWVSLRALGFATGKLFSIVATAVLLVVWIQGFAGQGSANVGVRLFAVPVSAVMLAIVVWMDVTEIYSQNIADAAGRRKTREFVLRHGLKIFWFGIAGFVVTFAFIVPLLEEWQFQRIPQPTDPLHTRDRLTLQQNLLFKFCESVTAVFFFVFGACVGSFLNVVIYRVPLRISVLMKPSHCPGCSEKIKGYDNVPISGWLKLKGQCRNCAISISARYPAVELTIGMVFTALFFVELISGGVNLPGRTPNAYAGVLWMLFYLKAPDLIVLYLYHGLLICTVFSWAMIRRDGHNVPRASILVMFLLLVVPQFVLQYLQLLPAFAMDASWRTGAYQFIGIAVNAGIGALAGLVVAGIAKLLRTQFQTRLIPDHLASWMLIGAVLNWQAVVGVVVLVIAWRLLGCLHRAFYQADSPSEERQLGYHDLVLPGILFAHHCLWRQILEAVS